MLGYLMARYGVPTVGNEAFSALPLYLSEVARGGLPRHAALTGCGTPPGGGIAAAVSHRRGVFLIGEVYGCKQLIYVKDEDGLYTANPKTNPDATLIPRAHRGRGGGDESARRRRGAARAGACSSSARYIRSIQVINGLTPGNLRRAVEGEHVGNIITAD